MGASGTFLTRRRMFCSLHLLCVLSSYLNSVCEAKSISGHVKECTNEGQRVDVDLVAQNPCYSCFCKNGLVECQSQACPSLEGCHAILFSRPRDSCCDQCKGCISNGSLIPHGHVWPTSNDPCQVRMCQAGVLTTAREMCRPLCSDPVTVPGQCCPSCSGCHYEGVQYMSGEHFSPKKESGVKCTCKAGNITCVRRPCPVLNCHPESMYRVKGEMCPRCKGQRVLFTLHNSCYFAKEVYSDGDVVVVDKCTSCVCQSGTMQCERQQCPPLTCPKSQLNTLPGECCPKCVEQETCQRDGIIRQDGDVWTQQCKTCVCLKGKVQCHKKECAPVRMCPSSDSVSIEEKDPCCPTCVTREPTCTVKGSNFDTFKTFDEIRYRLQGSCMYELARDCDQDKFKIRIRYSTKAKTERVIELVAITLGATKVKLYNDMKIRVNKTHLPWYRSTKSQTFDIMVRPPVIVVRDRTLGVKVNWNVLKRLTVRVNQEYIGKKRMCGLCGNLNGVKEDDFMNSRKEMVLTPKQLANAWRRGKRCRENEINFESHGRKNRKIFPSLANTKEINPSKTSTVNSRISHPDTDASRTKQAVIHSKTSNGLPYYDKFERGHRKADKLIFWPDSDGRQHQTILTQSESFNFFGQLKESPMNSEDSINNESPFTSDSVGKQPTDDHSSSQNMCTTNCSNSATINVIVYDDEFHGKHRVNTTTMDNSSEHSSLDFRTKDDALSSIFPVIPNGNLKSESSQDHNPDSREVYCQSNSVEWAKAQDECLSVRNWIFFTCAGSLNVGKLASTCVEDVCACQGDRKCQKRVISRQVRSCVRLIDTNTELNDLTSSSSSSSQEEIDIDNNLDQDISKRVDR